jgi:hypothetical protein
MRWIEPVEAMIVLGFVGFLWTLSLAGIALIIMFGVVG